MGVGVSGLEASLQKMREAGLGEAALASFAHYYEQLRSGETGMLPERDLEPVDDLPALEELPEADGALDQALVLKLNGGLGTSMGMTRAKSLLEVKDGLTFLDLIARQVLDQRARTGARLPLVLMSSFATRADSLAALRAYPELESDVPADFVQNRVPKLLADTLEPVRWPADPGLEWAPPGHGDLFVALSTSGMLDALLDRGYRYAFVSNSDNLGAVLEPRILGWMAGEGIPLVMEAIGRTEADRKGGHLARRRGSDGLVLREIAQTPQEDLDAFQDVKRHRFFNANTLWIDLRALADLLDARGGALGLPMIVNRKTVDPTDPSSPEVIQLETAMGAAIDVFEGACAIRVPRSRFVPVKTTDDLLILRSDAYRLTGSGCVELVAGPPLVRLDPRHFKLLRDFEARFPDGPPSLAQCERLEVEGDVSFGRDVVVRGSVRLQGPARIEDGAVLEG
jgi:UTP--glucose-1-phosphate uridylyltransferase